MSITKMEKDCQTLHVVLRKLERMDDVDYKLVNAVWEVLEIKERQLFEARKHRYRNSTK